MVISENWIATHSTSLQTLSPPYFHYQSFSSASRWSSSSVFSHSVISLTPFKRLHHPIKTNLYFSIKRCDHVIIGRSIFVVSRETPLHSWHTFQKHTQDLLNLLRSDIQGWASIEHFFRNSISFTEKNSSGVDETAAKLWWIISWKLWNFTPNLSILTSRGILDAKFFRVSYDIILIKTWSLSFLENNMVSYHTRYVIFLPNTRNAVGHHGRLLYLWLVVHWNQSTVIYEERFWRTYFC